MFLQRVSFALAVAACCVACERKPSPTPEANPAAPAPPGAPTAPHAPVQATPALLLRNPSVSQTQIVFSSGDDLWIVDRSGGEAHRLTSDVGIETNPFFSPDGTLVAFSGEYDGNQDVYLVPASGGQPKRLTSHPAPDQVVGWTPDGKRILFRSTRGPFNRRRQLYTVGLDGGFPEEVPLPMAEQGSYSADATHLAYVPFSNGGANGLMGRSIKHYRGGTAAPIWVAKLEDSSIEKVPRKDSNDTSPMWLGNTVYFLSDRNGPVSLFAYDTTSKQVTLAIATGGLDIKSASAGPDVIVYEQFGSLHLFDPKTKSQRSVPIRLAADFPAVRPHFMKVGQQLRNPDLSPSGARAVFEANGEILTVPAEHGDIRNLTNTPGIADRDPAWSPDGKSIAYFSDESGEYALHIRPQEGLGEVRKIDLGTPPSFFYSPTWSPDSKRIAYYDKRYNLWLVDIERGKPVLVDTSPFLTDFSPAWSPDSRYLAYTRPLPTGLGAVFIYDVGASARHQVTDGSSDAASAAFDRNGKYLYFLASTDSGPILASSMAGYKLPVTRSGYLLVLSKDQPSPLMPLTDEEKPEVQPGRAGAQPPASECKVEEEQKKDAAPKTPPVVKIDFEAIDQRLLALPFPARNYSGLLVGKSHLVYLLEGPTVDARTGPNAVTVHKFDLCTRKTDKLLERVRNFVVAAKAEKALYEQLPPPSEAAPGGQELHGPWFIKALASLGKPPEPGKPEEPLKLDAMEVYVDPHAEWEQMYREVWRIERDFFYDPNLHGVDRKALIAAYQPYVDAVMSRADLTYIFTDMLGDITAQHIYITGGDRPSVKHVGGGLLGADYSIDHNRYRFAHIYRGENWNPDVRAPLTEPGVNVHEGDYLLAVNGRELFATDEVYAFFEETAGKTVQLKLGPDPSGKGARLVAVVPIANEQGLRLRGWMEQNRRKVDQLSDGRLAYVYLPDTAVNGFTNFNRYYFAQSNRQGAVIDERHNSGGWIADYVVDWLSRPLLMVAMTREGDDDPIPRTIRGPKVMLLDEDAGSGGDALPWMFRKLALGPLIGTRTWGGLIGIGGYPFLMDGGQVTAPRWALYNPVTGEFDVENKGVSPDIVVEEDPALVRKGQDPQLERSVAVALENLQQHPPAPIKRPKYPVYDWAKMRQEAP